MSIIKNALLRKETTQKSASIKSITQEGLRQIKQLWKLLSLI